MKRSRRSRRLSRRAKNAVRLSLPTVLNRLARSPGKARRFHSFMLNFLGHSGAPVYGNAPCDVPEQPNVIVTAPGADHAELPDPHPTPPVV